MVALKVGMILGLIAVASATEYCGIDLTFVLDSSQSVTEANWIKMKKFVKTATKDIVTKLGTGIGEKGTQVALVPFNDYGEVKMYLNQAVDSAFVDKKVDSMIYTPGLTNIHDALSKVVSDVHLEFNGNRPHNPDVVVLVTDGYYTKGTKDPSMIAEKLRENSKLIVVGIEGFNGGSAQAWEEELVRIAGGDASQVITVEGYGELSSIVDSIASKIPECK